jgi:uncharacterized membrane protein
MKNNKEVLRNVITAGLFAAVICVVTVATGAFMPKMSNGGYVNLGDSIIYMTAALINPVYAMFAAGIGSGLADLFLGAGVYILPTTIIKGLMGLICAFIAKEGKFSRYIIACVVGGLIMLGGYFGFEAITVGVSVATANMLVNLIQFAGGILFALLLYKTLPRIRKSINK